MGLDLSTQPNLDRWRRRIKRHRRPIAAALAALSVFAIIGAVSDSGGPTTTVVIAATDIPAGTTLILDDLTTAEFPADLAPPGAPDDPATITGEVVTAGVITGEVITTSRLLGSRPEAGRGLVAAPVRLADAGVAGLLAPGDVVDVIAASTDGSALIAAFTEAFITPLVNLALGGGIDAGQIEINGQIINFSLMVNAIITFLITLAVIYFVFVVPVNKYRERLEARQAAEPEAEPEPTREEQLLVEIRDLLAAQQRS
jgi:Flp pilus assembly protein CpaB